MKAIMPIVDDDAVIREILVNAKTIAVVGLSDKPWRDSYTVAEFLKGQGYLIVPVNPMIQSVFGLPAVSSLEGISRKVDIVNVFRRPEHIPAIVEAAIAIHARTVWMQSGIIHEPAARRASNAGLNVVMDRCIRVAHTLLVP